jgi:hypothetical protein
MNRRTMTLGQFRDGTIEILDVLGSVRFER